MPTHINRRRFLQCAAVAATSARLAAQKPALGSFSVRPVSLGVMPPGFTGLSYESSPLADPEFFSPGNADLIGLFRSLSPNGVLRIGGNLSAFTVWRDDPSTPVTPEQQSILDRGKKFWEWRLSPPAVAHGSHEAILSPKSIEPLAAFLKVTGWKLIYGLNFALGTPEQAAAEAACVQQLAGPNLLAFQLGNEADFWRGGFRPPDWDFDHYYAQWSEWKRTIRAKVPNAPFAGPDTAVNLDWVQRLSQKAKADVAFLSTHHYAMGPAATASAGAARLLGPDEALEKEVTTARQARETSGRGFRNTECNSCHHGGQPGVSDAYVSALWCADYMLRLAKAGHDGVHLHGGGDGVYTPIAGDPHTGALAPRPL
jgi:cytochrome c5